MSVGLVPGVLFFVFWQTLRKKHTDMLSSNIEETNGTTFFEQNGTTLSSLGLAG